LAEIESSAGVPDARKMMTVAPATQDAPARKTARLSRREVRRIESGARKAQRPKVRPLRAAGTMVAAVALLASVAVPAYAAIQPEAETLSLQNLAEGEAQTLDVSASVESAPLTSASYGATTPEEIEEAKAAAAAAEAAKRAEEQAARLLEEQRQQQNDSYAQPQQAPDYAPPVAAGDWTSPLPGGTYRFERTVGNGHDGLDLSAPQGTPIYAAKGGTVVTSQEALGGWGVTIKIDHGDGTETLYGHMVYGSRLVEAGATVEAGQQIGQVGNTGRSFGSHLHIELRVNGAIVDPYSYLPV
jgi:murein DD-endopeptidase MepM/ murein hydrolase activator NlpD